MKSRIGLIGGGALGQQMINFLLEDQASDSVEIYYFDDQLHKAGIINAFPFQSFSDDRFKELSFYIGLGYKHLSIRQKICKQLQQSGFKLTTFVHKTSFVHPSANIGQGVFIYPMCNVDQEVEINDGVILNNSVTVSHNTRIHDSTFVAPGVVISGHVTINECCFIGAGSVVANSISIGRNVKIGVGSCITKNIEDNAFVIGNPMKILEKPFQLT